MESSAVRPKGDEYLERLSLHGRKILGCILERYNVKVGTNQLSHFFVNIEIIIRVL
jgi:hypothetical protein